jgi:hypothetical protein
MSSHSAHSHCPKGSGSVEYHPASQNLFYFADVEYPVVCFVLNVYRVDDGASELTVWVSSQVWSIGHVFLILEGMKR